MNPGPISRRVVTERLGWADRMVESLLTLPLEERQAFLANSHNIAAAESYLRRALEALLDLGRHLLAKGFGIGVTEYKQIAEELRARGVLSEQEASLLRMMAGYRNRMVHFYHEIEPDELYQLCTRHLEDIERVADAYRRWLQQHEDQLNDTL